MGEIRIKVRLTNAGDEALARRGQMPASGVRTSEVDALVGTGAVRSVIPPQIVQELGLQLRGQRVAEYADGRKESVGVTKHWSSNACVATPWKKHSCSATKC